jgi:hypothetical protein
MYGLMASHGGVALTHSISCILDFSFLCIIILRCFELCLDGHMNYCMFCEMMVIELLIYIMEYVSFNTFLQSSGKGIF